MSPKEEIAASRKDQIMNSAAALFASQGFYKTTTAHVAEAVGVTQPYVFHFFKSKEQLYLAVLERAYERLHRAFSAVDAPPEELAHKMGLAFNTLLESYRNEILLLMQCFTTPEPAIREYSRRTHSRIYNTVKTRFKTAGVPKPGTEASIFISCGLIITLSEILELPELSPWHEDLD
ncbi:TetR/AcrR family transcriptional regulator [Cohnella terricola]|uniref:TetR/AcrR family transcriptional regulator n=1 Tax=Cohnella terricola TaxID=1289167 RepID=A0A559J7W0_9BACL|nr:TetR/AcrR family transcriptional regulator [Cohnella terricola]TVX95969.1 TetR/AcrR family transcriptional regulator [Cohnella terricola]